MTLTELIEKVKAILPEATVDEDVEGQLIIFTNLTEGGTAGGDLYSMNNVVP